MITKERLEKLIKQGATIWHDDYGIIKLDNECEICEGISFDCNHQQTIHQILCFNYYYNNEKHNSNVEIDELEEDVENAEWHYNMDAQRVEKLILPSWKDLEKKKEFFRVPFIGKDGALYGLCVDFEDKWCGIDVDGNCEIDHIDVMTKENYKHICDICRKLFLGIGQKQN